MNLVDGVTGVVLTIWLNWPIAWPGDDMDESRDCGSGWRCRCGGVHARLHAGLQWIVVLKWGKSSAGLKLRKALSDLTATRGSSRVSGFVVSCELFVACCCDRKVGE